MPQSKITTVSTRELKAGKIVHIPDETAQRAVELLEEQMDTGEVDAKRIRAADILYGHYKTQNRLSPERIKELAKKPGASQDVRDLANLTTEELNALQAKML